MCAIACEDNCHIVNSSGIIDVRRTPCGSQLVMLIICCLSSTTCWMSMLTNRSLFLPTNGRSISFTSVLLLTVDVTSCYFSSVKLTPSVPAVPNCCCSKGPAPYWSKLPFLIFDIRALWRSGLSARAPECRKLKMAA